MQRLIGAFLLIFGCVLLYGSDLGWGLVGLAFMYFGAGIFNGATSGRWFDLISDWMMDMERFDFNGNRIRE